MDDKELDGAIKLSGDALEAAREFRDLLDKVGAETTALSAEMTRRHAEIMQRAERDGFTIWHRIAEPYGLNARDTWRTGSWATDTQYVAHGDAYLRRLKGPQISPLAAAMSPSEKVH